MGTVIVGVVVAGVVGLIVRSMVKDKKAGKSLIATRKKYTGK